MGLQLSINTMIMRISGLKDTTDVTPWENKFITDIVEKTNDGERTSHLSGKQVEIIERIHDKHFA